MAKKETQATAEVFMTGLSHAVRLPQAFRFECDTVTEQGVEIQKHVRQTPEARKPYDRRVSFRRTGVVAHQFRRPRT